MALSQITHCPGRIDHGYSIANGAGIEHVVRDLAGRGTPRVNRVAPCKEHILGCLRRRCMSATEVAEITGMQLRAVRQAVYEMRVMGMVHVSYRTILAYEMTGPGRRRHIVNHYRASM
jgi:hypothetical protein